ncbi:DUF421 domain-containing protein [Desertivirga arenae]|uniref:DUF421 domain-containing protein n=1 Tax=Desertivirga arenae TaxID=2810309 RepID=UPI001A9583C5|nr:YetF domain-containing protein [Pedobacter sp. SYSU D00823]
MEKKDIQALDWNRILLGEAPAEFLLEVLIRSAIIYLALLIIVRLLGKRMSGQLTLSETAVMVTLGAIISSPMQDPQKGILEGILVLIIALLFYRGFNLWGYNSSTFEKISQGHSSLLVKDGKIHLEGLNETRLTRQELFAQLRRRDIYNLGTVKRAYLEGCGVMSIFKEDNVKPGLPLLPEKDQELGDYLQKDHLVACFNCGNTSIHADNNCENCGQKQWTVAVTK